MKPSEHRVVLAGNGGWENRGCEAIEVSVRSIIDAVVGPVFFTIIPFGEGDREITDDASERLAPLDWRVPPLSAERIVRSMNARGLIPSHRHWAFRRPFARLDGLFSLETPLVQIGGDNFTVDYGNPDRFFALNDYALRRGSPVVLWGASIGPFSSDRSYEQYAAMQLRRVSLILARESMTVEYLASIGVTSNVRTAMDPAFTLEEVEPREGVRSLVDGSPVGLNVSPLFGRYTGEPADALSDEVKRLAESIVTHTRRPVLFLPHVMTPGQDDHEWHSAQAEELLARLPSDTVRITPRDLSAQELKWCASRCSVVIGSRTHLTIASISSAVPTISLGYSAKARGINYEVFGHERYVVPAKEFSAESVAEILKDVLEHEADIRHTLQSRQETLRSSATLAGREFAGCVGWDMPAVEARPKS